MPSLVEKIKSRSSNNVARSLKCKIVTPKLGSLVESNTSRVKLIPPTYDVDDTGKPKTANNSYFMPKKELRPIRGEDQWSFKQLYKHLS